MKDSEEYWGNSDQCNESVSPARLQKQLGDMVSSSLLQTLLLELSRPHLSTSLTPSDLSFQVWSPPASSVRVPLLSRPLCSHSDSLHVLPLGSGPSHPFDIMVDHSRPHFGVW